MTYEYAAYYKLLLLCGYGEELQKYIDMALVEQEPLSEIVLELATAGADDKNRLSVLSEYLWKAKDTGVDYDHSVFKLVTAFLKRKYDEGSMPMAEVTQLMYKIAANTERCFDEPWYTMHLMDDLRGEAEIGFIDKEDFQCRFEAFINDGVCLTDYPPANKIQ